MLAASELLAPMNPEGILTAGLLIHANSKEAVAFIYFLQVATSQDKKPQRHKSGKETGVVHRLQLGMQTLGYLHGCQPVTYDLGSR